MIDVSAHALLFHTSRVKARELVEGSSAFGEKLDEVSLLDWEFFRLRGAARPKNEAVMES